MSDVDFIGHTDSLNAFLRTYCESEKFLAWVKDLDGRYIGASPAWCAASNIRRSQITGLRDADIAATENISTLQQVDDQLVGCSMPLVVEMSLTDGSDQRSYSITGLPILDDKGCLIASGAVAIDITSNSNYSSALEKLLLIGNRLELTLEDTIAEILNVGRTFFKLPVGLVGRVDGDHYVIEHVETAGVDATECGDRLVLEETICAAVMDARSVVALHDTTKAPREICPSRDWMPQKAYLGAPILINGSVYGTVVFTDLKVRNRPFDQYEIAFSKLLGQWLAFVIERNRRIEEYKRSRSELQLIFDHVPVRIIHKNADNIILRANRAMADSVGYSPEEMAGMRVDNIFKITHDELFSHDRIVFESGKPLLGTIRQTNPRKGKTTWQRIDKIPYDDPFTGERTILAVFLDITELMEKEQALERVNEDLRQFAYVASHDLQEPFRKIRTFSDILRSGLARNDDKEVDYALQVMNDSAQRGSDLIADLLNYSWVDRDRDMVSRLDLGNAIDEVLSDLWLVIWETSTRIARNVQPIELAATPSHIRQIVQNFISNAIKFRHPDRRPEITIAVSLNDANGSATLRVTDNGIGFDPAQNERIFEPFRRLHTQSDVPGSGIGLAVCARLAARNGWELSATGKPDEGADFSVTFPEKNIYTSDLTEQNSK